MKKKITKLLGTLAVGAASVCPLLTSCSEKTPDEYHIMHLSDIHGEIPGYGDDYFNVNKNYAGAIRMADAMQEIAQKSKGSIILAGGDQNSSGTFSAPVKGKSMYPVMKAMDIAYSAVGNHAWDWGNKALVDEEYDTLGRTEKTKGKYFISANVLADAQYRGYNWCYDESQEQFLIDFKKWDDALASWVNPYKVIDFNNHKVCLIGLTTQDALIDGNQAELKTYSFADYIPSIHYAKYKLKTKEGEEAFNQIESFIILAHAGAAMNEQKYISGEMSALAINLDTPIDAILAGHTHSSICGRVYNNKFDKPIWIAETSSSMQDFTDTKLTFDDTKPVGQRLKSIDIKLVTPYIDNSSKEAAAAQLDRIIANPRNEIVRKTAEVYLTQKEDVKKALQKTLGVSSNGLNYLQKDWLFDYCYPFDLLPVSKKNIFVEQAGAFLAKAEIEGFNRKYAEDPNIKKADICYIGNSSIHEDIIPGEVSYKTLYGLYPYDNYTVTASLTYYQLKQIASYMLTGATLDTETRLHGKYCTDEYRIHPSDESFVIQQLRYPYGPNQFYGFSFGVIKATDDEKQARRFQFTDDIEMKVYDYDEKENGCNIDDPDTWLGEDHWMNADGTPKKYITIVMNDFDFYRGNQQNMMIYYFALANAEEKIGEETLQIKDFTSLDPRQLAVDYMTYLVQTLQKTIDLDDSVCAKLIQYKEI